METTPAAKRAYEAPTVTVIGDLHDLTLASNKDFKAPSDGVLFKGSPILGSI